VFSIRQSKPTAGTKAVGVRVSVPELLALRQQAVRLPLLSTLRASSKLAGALQSRQYGQGLEFEDLRHYQPGDDVRHIHWRSMARDRAPLSRVFSEERERPVFLVVDQRMNMFFGSQAQFKSVVAAKIAAALAWSALAEGTIVGALVFGCGEWQIKSARGRAAVLELINVLVEASEKLQANAITDSPLHDAVSGLERKISPGNVVVVISDFCDLSERFVDSLSILAYHNQLALIRVFDPLEEAMAVRRVVGVSNGESTAAAAIDDEVRQRYKMKLQLRLELLEQTAVACSANLTHVSTATDPLTTLASVR